MRFPFEWGQAPGRSSTKDTKDTRGLDSGKHCSCCNRLMPLVSKDPERTRKRERAKERNPTDLTRRPVRQKAPFSLHSFPTEQLSLSRFRPFAFSRSLRVFPSPAARQAQRQNSRS